MKSGLIHVCFVLDESSSMSQSVSDVCGGFNSVIKEQKEASKGQCLVSLYRFASNVKKDFIGKDVNEIPEMTGNYASFSYADLKWSNTEGLVGTTIETHTLTYHPNGMTAMNDGIGTAIDEIGKWLAGMPEEERPEKNLIVIMTDGEENYSKDYSIDKVKEMIKHQSDVYDWSFVYMGQDITDTSYGNTLLENVKGSAGAYGSRGDIGRCYATLNHVVSNYRSSDADYAVKNMSFCTTLASACADITNDFEVTTGTKLDNKAGTATDTENN